MEHKENLEMHGFLPFSPLLEDLSLLEAHGVFPLLNSEDPFQVHEI